MLLDEKPQLKENNEIKLKEKEEPQLEVNEKNRLNRRTLVILAIALVTVLVLLFATAPIFSVNFNCPDISGCYINPPAREYKPWYWYWCIPCPVNP